MSGINIVYNYLMIKLIKNIVVGIYWSLELVVSPRDTTLIPSIELSGATAYNNCWIEVEF